MGNIHIKFILICILTLKDFDQFLDIIFHDRIDKCSLHLLDENEKDKTHWVKY